uniref:MULE transposase domain-containing protein n=1 Tax=Ditylenchus dipsaci TaxID=166011 RepID=A0A915E926_9BILA
MVVVVAAMAEVEIVVATIAKKPAENGRNQIGKRQSDGSVWQLSDEEGLRLRKQAHSILAMLNGMMPCRARSAFGSLVLRKQELMIYTEESRDNRDRTRLTKSGRMQWKIGSQLSINSDERKGRASQAVIESLPADFNIKRIVTNKRKPKGAAEVDKALAVMELSDKFKKTATGEQFLFFDSRATEPGQSVIIIFISMHGRQLLRLYKNWSIDGTFFSCPLYFKQLFTINVFKENSTLPAAYILQDKSEYTYRRAMTALFSRLPGVEPNAIMSGCHIHAANPADPVRNPRPKAIVKREEQILKLVTDYTAVDPLLRQRLLFLRYIQTHMAKLHPQCPMMSRSGVQCASTRSSSAATKS